MALTWTTPEGSIGTYTETKPISFQFIATTTTPGTVVYSLSSGYIPTGTSLSSAGQLTGVPQTNNTDTAQVVWFGIKAELINSSGASVEQVYGTFTVSIAPWLSWVTKAGSLGEYSAYSSVNITLQTIFPPVQISYVHYSIGSGTLPTGLSLNTTTGVISGKPTTTELVQTSTFSVIATGYTFSGVEVARQTQQFSITVGMWATPPLGSLESNILGPFTGGQSIHPVQFICSPGSTDFFTSTGAQDKISYRIVERGLPLSLSIKKVTFNGVTNITAAELIGIPPVVLADTELAFTLRVTKQNSVNVTITEDRRFVYRVLARSQPQWIDAPGPLGNVTESTAFTHVFSAQPAVRGDTVNFALLNGSYPAGNLTLTQTANNTATLSGTLDKVAVDTTTPFTIRATEKNVDTVVGISDRTFDITVTGPTPPSFATVPGMLADMSTRYYADVPSPPISKITINGINNIVISITPYNLTNYGITNNSPIYLAGITGGNVTTLNNNMYYVSNADSSNSTFELCRNAGPNNTPINPLTASSTGWNYTGGGTAGKVALDSEYFETQITANLNDPDVTATFEIVGGLLPDGLEMNSSGLISGYPTSKRTTTDDAGLPVYWGAVDVNGDPTTKLSTFTVRVTTQSGSATAEYSIAILNQEAAWSLEQYLAGTNLEFPGRKPALLNTRPLTQVISNIDPYFAYYSAGSSNIGRFTQDNQLVYKMIGHNFNVKESESPEYGLTYTITGLSAGVTDGANAFAPTIATFTANSSNVVLTTLNDLGNTITFIGNTVGNTLLANGDAAAANTYVANATSYYWSAVPNTVSNINLYTKSNVAAANGLLVTPSANGTMQTINATTLVSPTRSNVSANGWINGTLGNIGTDINTYKFNVTVAAPNLVANINTTAAISNYSSIILVGNTYGLHAGRELNFTGNSVGNISNSNTYTIATVASTVTQPATITTGNTSIAIADTTGLAVNSVVTFSDTLGNVIEGTNYTVASISDGNTFTATFAANTPNILVDTLTSLALNQPVTLASNVDSNLSNTATYFVRSLSNTIITSASTTTNSTITVNSTQGLVVGANVTVSNVTPRRYTKVVTEIIANTASTPNTYYANSNLSNTALANITGNLMVVLPDATNISNKQHVDFSDTEFGTVTNANVSNIYTVWKAPVQAGQDRRKITLVDISSNTGAGNTGSMTVTFIEPDASPSVNTAANAYQVASIANSTITLNETANSSNILNPNTHATMTLTTLAQNNITLSNVVDSNALIKSTTAASTTFTTRNPTITLTNLTPNTSGTLTMNYAAKHIKISANSNVVIANATGNMSIYSTDHPPLVSGPHEYSFVMSGTLNTGIGWSVPDGNLGTITTGSTSRLSIDATFGSDSVETTATIANGNANIAVVSAKSLLQGLPVTFTGNNVGNISNVATYYIKSNVSDTSTSLTISRTLGGNAVTPNASGSMTLRSSINDGRFKLIDGALPTGLKLLSTGEIVGRVAFQPTETYQVANTTTTYNFTVRAYSKKYAEITKDKEYSITTVQKYVEPYDNLYVSALIREEQRTKIDNLLTHISGTQNNDVTKNIYRSGDSNFGIASGVKYGHMYGVSSKASGTFYNAYATAIAKNHYYKNLTLGDLKTAVARDDTGAIIYEVIYSPIQDGLVSSAGVSVSKEIVQASQVLYPNSLINMRQQIEDTIGRINNSDVLPLWMVTQQTDGNVLGFVPCWVLCYTKPGKSSVVLSSINTYLTDNYFTLNQVSFDMDRFEVDRALTWTFGGTTGDTWPELTATFTSGYSSIAVNSTVGLVPNQPVKFTGTAVEGVNTTTTYYVSDVKLDYDFVYTHTNAGKIFASTDSNVVRGTDTAFTSALVGKLVEDANSNYIGTVSSVSSNTVMILSSNATANLGNLVALTGNISANSNSKVLTGVNTTFTTQLVKGATLTANISNANVVIGTIDSISNSTSAVLSANSTANLSNVANSTLSIPTATYSVVEHSTIDAIWVRNSQYGNITNTALIPQANGTMTLSTVPKSTQVADDSKDSYVIFTGNNILG